MPTAPKPPLSPSAVHLRVMGMGTALLFLWFVGTYVLDWLGAADWVYEAWFGAFALTSIIGGNVYRFYLRGGPTHRDWLGLAFGLLLIFAGFYMAVTHWADL